MLFKTEHRPLICEGTKTETRRPQQGVVDRRPAKPGAVRGFYTRPAWSKPGGVPFCRAAIGEVWLEPLGAITLQGAQREGYASVIDYGRVWDRIWGSGSWLAQRDVEIWVVEFQLVEQLACATCGAPREVEAWGRLKLASGGDFQQALQCFHCRRGSGVIEWQGEPPEASRDLCA